MRRRVAEGYKEQKEKGKEEQELRKRKNFPWQSLEKNKGKR